MLANIRKTSVIVEETRQDIGREVNPPTRKAAALAVIENPFAGRYEEDLTVLMDIGAELGELLGRMCVEALGIKPEEAEGYGKAAIVGENGEWEHAAAILHPKLGAPLRKEVENGMEVRLVDAPRANEILVAVAVTDSGRPFPRVGGLTTDEMIGEDGLR
jgi:hypothetical protein